MIINSTYTGEFADTVGAVAKLVAQHIESGELKDRFSIFDYDEVPHGKGYELNVILAADNQPTKAAEHGNYKPNAISLIFSDTAKGQYAVTIDNRKIAECVGNIEKQQAYAAALTESLYQGWVNDKNAKVAEAINEFVTNSTATANVTLGTDSTAWALDLIAAIKAKVMDFKEGVTGTSYGNTTVGAKRIASPKIAIVMSNATAAALDAHGYAKAFNEAAISLENVDRVTTNRLADNTVFVTDSRNIQVRNKYENTTTIQNSDGTLNTFYNKEAYIEAAYSTFGAFPHVVIKTVGA